MMKKDVKQITVEYADGSTETIPLANTLTFGKYTVEIGLKFEVKQDTFAIVAKGHKIYLF